MGPRGGAELQAAATAKAMTAAAQTPFPKPEARSLKFFTG
jgi:hypothetical protein